MTVNMDTMRDRAWDVYIADGKSHGLLFGMDKSPREAFIVGFGAAANEAGRLRAVIENAPHANGCSSFSTSAGLSCNCWKRGVL